MSHYKNIKIMKKEMFALSHMAAEVIYNALCIKTNCFFGPHKKLVRADSIIAVDDDPTSAFWAVWLYYKTYTEHGYYPTIICVGGKGLMSRHTHDKSEAELLAYVCQRLGVNPEHIVLAPLGNNSGANVQSVKKIVASGQTVIWSLTKRLSLRMERTIAQQAPEILSYYYVIEETLDEAAKTINGKGLAQMEMMFHELASILERCEKYAGTFQKPIDGIVNITPEIREANDFLCEHYRLKLMNREVTIFGKRVSVPNKNLKSVCQYLHLLRVVKASRQQMKAELEWEMHFMCDTLIRQNLITQQQKDAIYAMGNNREV